jgi:hypothetical protein
MWCYEYKDIVMTVTPATDSAESVLKALTANGTALSKRAATLITKQGAALYESNVHLKAAQDKLDALAAEATRAAMVIDAPPPVPVDLPGAYSGMVERAACAAIVLAVASDLRGMTTAFWDGADKTAIFKNALERGAAAILAQPVPVPGSKA